MVMKFFRDPRRRDNWWGKQARKTGPRGLFVFKKYISTELPSFKDVLRPALVVLTAGMMTLVGFMPALNDYLRVARAATITVCASGCDHTTIIAAHNASSDGDTLSLSGEAYSVTSTLVMDSRAKKITGAGSGSTTVNLSTSGAAWTAQSSQSAGAAYQFSGINFQGGGGAALFDMYNQSNSYSLTIADNRFDLGSFGADMVFVSSTVTNAATLKVIGNTIGSQSGLAQFFDYDGVNSTSASSLVLSGNTLTKGSELFDMATSTFFGTVTVEANTIANYNTRAVRLLSGSTIDVVGNTIGTATTTKEGIQITPRSGATINVINNSITLGDGSSNAGITITNADQAAVAVGRNTVSGPDYGIVFSNDAANDGQYTVRNNLIYDVGEAGISLGPGGTIAYSVINNTVDNVGGSSKTGIDASNGQTAAYYTIMNNNVTNVGGTGISCTVASNRKVVNNNVYDNSTDFSSCGTAVGSNGNIDVIPPYSDHNSNTYTLSSTSTCDGSTHSCDSGTASTTIFMSAVSAAGSTSVRTATDLNGDDFNGLTVTITSGTGSGQSRTISDVAGATEELTISSAWDTTPDTSSTFAVQVTNSVDRASSTRLNNSIYDIGGYELQQNIAPSAPTTLYGSSGSAQSGTSNPTNVQTTTPSFSALYIDDNSGDIATKARIQVASSSDFASKIYWDSQKTTMTSTTAGNRIKDISFNSFGASATSTLALNDGAVTYYWRIKFWDDDDAEGAWSTEEATFTLFDNLTAPSNASTSYGSDTSLGFTWTDNATNESGYKVYLNVNNGSTTLVSTTAANVSVYNDTTTISANNKYIFSVAATDGTDDSASSTADAIYTTPSAPSAATSTSAGTDSIVWSWTDNANYADSFRLDSEQGELIEIDNIGYAGVTTTQRTQDSSTVSLSPATKYGIHLHAYNNQRGESDASSVFYAYTAPASPVGVSASGDGDSSILVSWPDSGNPSTTTLYYVENTTAGTNSGWMTGTNYTFTGLAQGTAYSFRVKSRAPDETQSSYSSTVSTTVSGSSSVSTEQQQADSFGGSSGGSFSGFGGGLSGFGSSGDSGAMLDGMFQSCGPGCITFVPEFSDISAEDLEKFRKGELEEEEIDERLLGQFYINRGAKRTRTTSVTLGFNSPGMTHVAVSTDSSMNGVPMQPYTGSITYELSEGDGQKILYAQFFNLDKGSKSILSQATIILDTSPPTKRANAPTIADAPAYDSVDDWIAGGSSLSGSADPFTFVIMVVQKSGLSAEAKDTIRELRAKRPPGAAKRVAVPAGKSVRKTAAPVGDEQKAKLPALGEDLDEGKDVDIRKELAAGTPGKGKGALGRDAAGDLPERGKRPGDGDSDFPGGFGPGELPSLGEGELGDDFAPEFSEGEFPSFDPGFSQVPESSDIQNIPGGDSSLDGSVPTGGTDSSSGPGRSSGGSESTPSSGGGSSGGGSPSGSFPSGGFGGGDTSGFSPFSTYLKTVRIAVADKTTHITQADSSGNWTYQFHPETFSGEGEYTVSAGVEDSGGNVSEVSSFSTAVLSEDQEIVEAQAEVYEQEIADETSTDPEPQPEPVEVIEVITPEVTESSESTGGGGGGGGGDAPERTEKEILEELERKKRGLEQPGAVTAAIIEVLPEGIADAAIVTIEVAQAATEEVVAGVKETVRYAKIVADNPVVEQVNETVAAPTVAVATAANVATGANLPTFLLYLRFLFLQPSMLFGRKKKKSWGVVYNGFTKLPVDLALVRLTKADGGAVVKSRVTDTQGRYLFMAQPGTYQLEVQKPGYGTISKHLGQLTEDGDFKPLYHGDKLPIAAASTPIAHAIPVDPDSKKADVKSTRRKFWWKKIRTGLSFAGVIFAVISFAISQTILTGALALFQVVGFFVFSRLARSDRKAKEFGTIKDKETGEAIEHAVVRIFDKEYNKLLDSRVTNKDGRYIFLVGQNTYYIMVEADGYAQYISKPFTTSEPGSVTLDVTMMPPLQRAGAPSEEQAQLATGPGTSPQKEKEVDQRDPGKTRISADGIPQPSAGFLEKMGVSVATLARTTLGAELPLAAAGAGSQKQTTINSGDVSSPAKDTPAGTLESSSSPKKDNPPSAQEPSSDSAGDDTSAEK